MGDCRDVTYRIITPDMLKEYPELGELGLEEGEKISIGMKPFDGIVEGPMKKIGECADTCRIGAAQIDGNEPFKWQGQFVQKYFPDELRTLEKSSPDESISACYADELKETVLGYTLMLPDLSENDYSVIERYSEGTATQDDLKKIDGMLGRVIDKLRGEGKNPNPIIFARSMIKAQMKAAPTVKEAKTEVKREE